MSDSKEPNLITYTHPHLLGEWDCVKNGNLRPRDLTYGSHKKVWWKCSKCRYKWEAEVKSRTLGKTGCPACVGKIVTDNNRFSILYPHLLDEWDYFKNKEDPTKISFASNKKVWWKCKKCCYGWKATLAKRTTLNRGCPACAGQVVTEKNSLLKNYPEISCEFDKEKNVVNITELSYGSNKLVWWVCSVCTHSWKTAVHHRTLQGTGCPACSGNVISGRNKLSKVCPELVEDWHRNKNSLEPCEVSYGSKKKVWWKCSVCAYEWEASIVSRYKGNGCPACSHKVITDEYNLRVLYPDLIENEWDHEKNTLIPEKCFPGTYTKVWWVCSKCSHSWETSISGRVSGNGCPLCAVSRVSTISQSWLDLLSVEKREHWIKGLKIHVDGFDPETNTVYEFLGDYWHGNPKIYSAEKLNSHNKKSFGELYRKTIDRINLLKENGYEVVYIWESDYISGLALSPV